MAPRFSSLGKSRGIWISLAILPFLASWATAQTPTNTWIATTSGNWSVGANWSTGTPPASAATTTTLQFNATGTTSYTADNDLGAFSLLGIIGNSSSSNPITLTDGALTLSASGTTGFINQNGSGAVVINNNLVVTNASSATDMSIGGTGSGTLTLNGVISGVGGLQINNVGGSTIVISNPANSFSGSGLTTPIMLNSPNATLMVTATSGGGAAATSPLGNLNFTIVSGTLNFAPAATGGAVTVGLATGKNLGFGGGGTVALTKGGNTSLTVTTNALTYTLTGNSSGTMVLSPASGIAALGTATGEMLVTGATTTPTLINGVMAPVNVGQTSQSDSTGDYLTYGAAGFTGVSQFQGYTTYNTPGGSFGTSAAGTEISNVTAATTASANASIQALRVGASGVNGTTLTIGSGSTVTIAGATYYSGRPNLGGVILNNGATIAGPGTLAFGGNEMDLYASAGTSTISAQVTSTNNNATGPSIIKFGPGNIILANSTNSFAAGAEYTLYGGYLGIIGPGGSNPSTALGTGAHTFVMRGGGFEVTGGDYAPAAGTLGFLLAAGGGGFLVDGANTFTLAQTGQLSSVGTGPLFKTGTGTMVLNSAYSLQGMSGVLVNQGQLQVNAALAGNIGTGTLAVPVPTLVNNSGTLSGTGAVPGNVFVNSGGTIAPGAVATISKFNTGGASLQPGGSYVVKYNPATSSPVAGVDNDDIASAAGILDLSALSPANHFVLNLEPDGAGTPVGGPVTYTIGQFASGILPNGVSGPDVTSLFTFTGLYGGTPTASETGGALSVTFTPVPEPGTMLLAGSAALGMWRWSRRRRLVRTER